MCQKSVCTVCNAVLSPCTELFFLVMPAIQMKIILQYITFSSDFFPVSLIYLLSLLHFQNTEGMNQNPCNRGPYYRGHGLDDDAILKTF